MNKLKRYLLTLYYNHKYSFVDDTLCCCGSDDCSGDMSHCFRSAKEYAVTSTVNKKIKGVNYNENIFRVKPKV
jgi:hypothetical protein